MKAKAVIETEVFTSRQLLITFETPEQMAKFYAVFNHTAIVDRVLQDDAGTCEIWEELNRLLPDVDTTAQKHLDKLNELLREDWRDV